ncbi:MAG: hypothetical protein O3B13_22915, partial [Planctomycetota bacterium]|nr:hypothetical protein [Planctomycetota bacterium]MDA1165959.1 hypothetical protein [Planctomycetota bacterium]
MTSISTFERVQRYRQTPFREHVVEEMGWGSQKSWEQSLRDVLALDDMRRNARGADQQALRQSLNSEQFFYHTKPDMVTYLPVKVVELADGEHSYLDSSSPDRIHHDDLTALIRTLDQKNDLSSIFLAARSGSGKTVAARKAFCDCVRASSSGDVPLLGDYLPCWINVDAIDDFAENQLIERLILNACNLNGAMDVAGLKHWLDQPELKLLLFFDLNAWSSKAREAVARDLQRFLSAWRDVGHRAVVAYRSSATNDAPCELLSPKRGQFRKYDLLPLNSSEATSYLRNVREFEKDVFFRSGIDFPDRDIDAECRQLGSLLSRHAGDQQGDEALVSTPLLMHFCSLLGPAEFSKVRTLSDLYGQVVQLYLDRDRSNAQLAEMTTEDFDDDIDHDTVRAAMTRLAAMIIAQPEGTVSVSGKQFVNALIRPVSGQRGAGTWWPRADEWHNAPWVSKPFSRQTARALQEFSLIRRDGDQVRFLHDSLIYYFVGAGVLLWTNDSTWPEPDMLDISAEWPSQVRQQLDHSTGMRENVVEFMGGALDGESFGDLFIELMVHTQDERMSAFVAALIRGADGGPNGRVTVATRLQQ